MISVVLIEPENPGNLGAIARSMKNFGFDSLVLINPKCSIDQDCRNRAKHAQDVLDGVKIGDWNLLDDYDYVVGTTSKVGRDYNIPRNPISPEELVANVDASSKVAIVIGRESDGLHNDEIAKCDFVVTIPAAKKYSTLNISHAVTIILYEFYKKFKGEYVGSDIITLSKVEKEQIMKMLDSAMAEMDFSTEDDRETQRKVWRRMITKSFMSKREAFALMGFLRKLL